MGRATEGHEDQSGVALIHHVTVVFHVTVTGTARSALAGAETITHRR